MTNHDRTLYHAPDRISCLEDSYLMEDENLIIKMDSNVSESIVEDCYYDYDYDDVHH